jgi:hypothetical protein
MTSPCHTMTWKKVSNSRMLSGFTLATSSNTGAGGPENVYDISVGCIITCGVEREARRGARGGWGTRKGVGNENREGAAEVGAQGRGGRETRNLRLRAKWEGCERQSEPR